MEGQVTWELLVDGSGQWVRGGMDGIVVGLDIGACLTRPSAMQSDAQVLEHLLSFGEIGAMEAFEKERKKSSK